MDGQGRERAGSAGRSRVLWLIKRLGPGGAQTLLASMAQAANHTTFGHHVAFVRDDKRHLVARPEAEGVVVHFIGTDRGGWPLALLRLVRELQPHVIHARSSLLEVVARGITRRMAHASRPLMLSTERNQRSSYVPLTRVANAVTSRWDVRRWAQSHDVRDSIWPRQRQRVAVLLHGLSATCDVVYRASRDEVRSALGMSPDDVVACTAASLRAHKDYPNLLSAALGGVPEAITEAMEGFLVPPGQPDELGRAVLTLARDPTPRTRFGYAAMARATQFEIGRAVVTVEEAHSLGPSTQDALQQPLRRAS